MESTRNVHESDSIWISFIIWYQKKNSSQSSGQIRKSVARWCDTLLVRMRLKIIFIQIFIYVYHDPDNDCISGICTRNFAYVSQSHDVFSTVPQCHYQRMFLSILRHRSFILLTLYPWLNVMSLALEMRNARIHYLIVSNPTCQTNLRSRGNHPGFSCIFFFVL